MRKKFWRAKLSKVIENWKTSSKLLTSSDDSYLGWSILKSPNESVCVEDSFERLCNKGEI